MGQELKLTKNELRSQQLKLGQLEKYLPTLRLKKAMLQTQVTQARFELQQAQEALDRLEPQLLQARSLFRLIPTLAADDWTQVRDLQVGSENIAGVQVPLFHSLEYQERAYCLSQTPLWLEAAVELLRRAHTLLVRVGVYQKRLQALQRELHEVFVRVNLFEKVLIPRAQAAIGKIRVFLQDQELAAVGRAKVAKSKHEKANAQARQLQMVGEVACEG